MHLLSVCACSSAYSSPLKRAPHFMPNNENSYREATIPLLRMDPDTVYILITLCEMPPSVKKFSGRGRPCHPASSTVENGGPFGYDCKFSPARNRNFSGKIPHIGPAGGHRKDPDRGTGLHAPVWIGALRSRWWGGALGENLRHSVNRSEGKTHTDPIGGALPPAVCYAFR